MQVFVYQKLIVHEVTETSHCRSMESKEYQAENDDDDELPVVEQTNLLLIPTYQSSATRVQDTIRNVDGQQQQEFVAVPVSQSQTVSWFRVALVFVTGSFSLPTFITGMDLYEAVRGGEHTNNVLSAILSGNLLLAMVASLCGVVGARTGLHSYALSRVAFGTAGAALFNISLVGSLVGWFGVNLNLFGRSIIRLVETEREIDAILIQFFGGAVMTLTAIHGFRAFEKLSFLLAPILAILTAQLWMKSIVSSGELYKQRENVSTISSFNGNNGDDDQQTRPSLPFGQAVSSVAGLSIVGAIISSDFVRFIDEWHGAIFSSFLSYLLVNSIVEWVSFNAAAIFQKSDLLGIMTEIGLQWEAFVILVAGCWILNAMNLYSLSLSIQATCPEWNNHHLVVGIFGFLGTCVAFVNLLDAFLTFLFYLSVAFSPVAGVIVVDYYLVNREVYHSYEPRCLPTVRPLSLLAWIVGITVRVTKIAALDAFLVGGISYLVISKCTKLYNERSTRGQ